MKFEWRENKGVKLTEMAKQQLAKEAVQYLLDNPTENFQAYQTGNTIVIAFREGQTIEIIDAIVQREALYGLGDGR